MISTNQDLLASQLNVRLKNSETNTILGTGVLYYEKKLKNRVYIFTAAHCLFKDRDIFEDKLESVVIDFYNKNENKYESIIIHHIDEKLISKDKDKDVAVIVIEKELVGNITGVIPRVEACIHRQNHSNFLVKGFPRATQGKELDVIFPIWKQKMTEVNKFQIELTESYSEYNIQGFSG